MSLSDPTHTRLDSLELAVRSMSDRVLQLAGFMERLVVLEERNGFMNEQMKENRDSFKEAIDSVRVQNTKLEEKFNSLNTQVIRLVTIMSFASTAIAVIAPFVIRHFFGVSG